MYSQELAQGHHSLVAVDRYTDPIDRIVREKYLSRMENMRISRKSRVLCDRRDRCAYAAQSAPVRPPSALA